MALATRNGFCRLALLLTLVAGCGLLGLGLHELMGCRSSQERYEAVSAATGDPSGDGGHPGSRALPKGAVAWVEVAGLGISLPVADGSRGNSWYLSHDLWGSESALGCPFIDARCESPDGPHVMVYGHHLAFTNLMFSPLHLCYRQHRFSELGTCTWSTASGSRELVPLCSLSVDDHCQEVLRFSFSGEDGFHDWLSSMVSASSARAPDAAELARSAHRALTLVTCSSNRPGQPWRTLVLFVA